MTQQSTAATAALATTGKPNAIIGVSMRDLSDVASLIFNSKVFGDLQSKEAAAIKIIAGQELGFSPFQSMSMFDFIQGRPTLNAHGKATLINSSGDFRLKIKELTAERCEIDVYRKNDAGEWKVIGTNVFTIEDAKRADLTTGKNAHSWKKYPRNMLFARCVSNIWRWECAELNVRRYSPEQIAEFEAPELAEDDDIVEGEIVVDGEIVDTSTGEVVEAAADEQPAGELPFDETADTLRQFHELMIVKFGDGEQVTDDEGANAFLNGRDPSVMPLAALQKLLGELKAM